MFEEVSDFSSPTPDDLVHPTNECTDQFNKKMFESELELYGENKPDLWKNVALLCQGKTQQQVQDLVQEYFALRDSNDVKGKGSSKRKGIWSEEEKWLFPSCPDMYGPKKWKIISSLIGTRSPEQVRSHARRMQRKRSSEQDIQSLPPETNRPIANPGHLPFPRTDYVPMMEPNVPLPYLPLLRPEQGLDGICGLPPETNRPIANPGHLPFPRTDYVSMMEPMVRASNVRLPYLPLLRPEQGLDNICGNFGGSVWHPSSNLRAEMGASPSSCISDQVWNTTNTLSSDFYCCLPGPSAYGNSMNPGQ